ncbi:right-handed parallel beta-helix repeat-containing protein [Natronococcus jeotgali]|uniref:right-handed parallel beta-helix repeat-containing protein n=1 Tax=Natronococcus jeotgali TaxID=413812 RepID=UPI0009FE80CA|nr:right-handed parallel beta-helix repeat-containing protein [Natronococcus jeotgali]
MVHETNSSRDRSRRAFIGAVGAAGLGLAASTSIAASSDGDPTPIDSPTVIEEPGEYELVADLAPDRLEQPGCILVDLRDEQGRSSVHGDFTLYGNGHTVDLSGTELDFEDPWRRATGIAFDPRERWGGALESSWDATVEDIEIRGANTGISSWRASFGTYTDVTVAENDTGFYFYIDGSDLIDCVIEENQTGVNLYGDTEVWGGSQSTFENCTIRSNDRAGIVTGPESNARIRSSRIIGNGDGVVSFTEGPGTVIEESHICYNDGYGVYGLAWPGSEEYPEDDRPIQASVQATNNYWGSDNGPLSLERRRNEQDSGYEYVQPDEPFTDRETGRSADGDGDAISESLESGVSNVRFDPFSEAPFDDVGAQR